VIEGDGVIVGFANFYKAQYRGICALGNVVVAPAARGKGVARYLVQCMIALAREQFAAREVWVSCFNHNIAGLLLYPQLGFVPFGIEERRAADGSRVALVQMKLQANGCPPFNSTLHVAEPAAWRGWSRRGTGWRRCLQG
jgi:ribosomal protein S18 acetylase RimI-like enzyme